MSARLDHVYRYRLLQGKCEAGAGLDLDEIDQLLSLEAAFGVNREADTALWACRRAFSREKVALSACIRNAKLDDPVSVIELGPGGVVCRTVPYVEEGDRVEFIFEDAEQAVSYRFCATVAWLDEDGEDYICGFAFIGTPLMVRFGLDHTRAETIADSRANSKHGNRAPALPRTGTDTDTDTGHPTDSKLERAAA